MFTVTVPVPALASCCAVSRIRVMIDASQVTTGVTPLALGVQYAGVMGIVNTFDGLITCGD